MTESLASGALRIVAEAPEFRLPAYAVCANTAPSALLDRALFELRALAGEADEA